MPKTVQRITPFLWFDSQADEAVNFYVSIFPNSSDPGRHPPTTKRESRPQGAPEARS